MYDFEERYYQTLSDRQLLELRDSIPSFNDRFYELEKEVLDFLKNLDVDTIEINTELIQRYQKYRGCVLSLNDYSLHLKELNWKLSKAFFFKKKHFKDQIYKSEQILKDLNNSIREYENDEEFMGSFNNEESSFYWSLEDYLDKFTSNFYKSFRRLYNDDIKKLNNKFKSIYYRIDKFEISEKNNPSHDSQYWWKWDRDYEQNNWKFITLRNKYRIRFSVKTYPYLTRWDLKYFPYYLGEYFQKFPSESIKIIDKVLLSRNNDSLINYLKDQNNS